MKTPVHIVASCLLLLGSGPSSLGEEPSGQAPAWVAELRTTVVSWDRATIEWDVGLAPGGIGPITVVLESRSQGEDEWAELGRFPLASGNHTNQTPWPEPHAILLPERILAPPPSGTDAGVVSFLPSFGAAYTHHRLEPDTVYEYRMKAVNLHGEAPYSDVLVLRTDLLPPPQPPEDLFVRNLSGNCLEVLWTRSSLAGEFLVERLQANTVWQHIATVDGTQHSWTDRQVSPGQTYRYRVRGRNGSGTSGPGTEFTAVAHRLRPVFHEPVASGLSAGWQQRSGVSISQDLDEAARSALWFSGGGLRALTTRPLVFLIGGFLEFGFRSDEPYNEGSNILAQASLNGKAWMTLGEIDPEKNRGHWRSISIELPPSWSSPGVQFRFLQASHGGEGVETWAIRDIRVLAIQGRENALPTISIHKPQNRMTRQSRRSVRLAGTATDNRKLLGWAWSLNNGPWKTSRLKQGRSASWFGIVSRLERGRNTIKVRAYDASGNLSSGKTKFVRVR